MGQQRLAAPAILDSYDIERRPHARKMIDLAQLMGRLIMPRSQFKALLVHGLMRPMGLLPPLRALFEELKSSRPTASTAACSVPGKTCGGQLAQVWCGCWTAPSCSATKCSASA